MLRLWKKQFLIFLLKKKKETGSDTKIFSFFAGVGMLDLGFQDAGYEIVFVNEFK